MFSTGSDENSRLQTSPDGSHSIYLDAKNVLLDILARLDLIVGEQRTAWNCIFINCMYENAKDDEAAIQETLDLFVSSYAMELRAMRVTLIEVKVRAIHTLNRVTSVRRNVC